MTIKDITYGGLSIALLSICSWISIPLAVPFTMQTFAIFFICFLFGAKRGSIYVFCYILCGLLGMPVFSGFQGGAQVIFGLTGGYIVGFLFSALLLWATQKIWSPCKKIVLLLALIGLVICYGFGTAWFLIISQQQGSILTIGSVLMTCVVPFILPDCIKIFLAYRLAGRLRFYISAL